jgi:nicotinate-nucleotide pyrophosphorylase (carboxylating)
MKSSPLNMLIEDLLKQALQEDIQDGDHSSLACIPAEATGNCHLLVKQAGIIAGIEVAKQVFNIVDSRLNFNQLLNDGDTIKPGDIAFTIEGSRQSLLKGERLALNYMQRMSGIATSTKEYSQLINHTSCKLLDTRKTTPNNRVFEKLAVKIGGGFNHRFGLYDMIMLKDNHIDFAGGIEQAIKKTNGYLVDNKLDLKIEIEVRDFQELKEVLATGNVDRIMLDNFSVEDTREALKLINGKYETESSGGIDKTTIKAYAETGVDFISVGALTHQINSLDLSLKAI